MSIEFLQFAAIKLTTLAASTCIGLLSCYSGVHPGEGKSLPGVQLIALTAADGASSVAYIVLLQEAFRHFNIDLSDIKQQILTQIVSFLVHNQHFLSAAACRLIFRPLSFTPQQNVKLDISLENQISPKLQIISCCQNR